MGSDDLRGPPAVDALVVLYGLADAPQEYVGCAWANPFEPALQPLHHIVVVAALVQAVQPLLEAAVLGRYPLELLGVAYRRLYLLPVPDDALVPAQPSHVVRPIRGHRVDVEPVERLPEVGPLVGDHLPVEAALEDAPSHVLEVLPIRRGPPAPVDPARHGFVFRHGIDFG